MLQRGLRKVTYTLRFRNLNSPCMRISTHVDVYESSEDDCRLFISNPTYAFVSFWPLYLRPAEGHKHGVSLHSLINFE